MPLSPGDRQYDLLKAELDLTQRQMDKYDQLSSTVKTWAVTLWAATAGWAFQSKIKQVVLLGALLVLIFWFFDGYTKTYRTGYKKRRDEVQGFLRELFAGRSLPANAVSPSLPIHDEKSFLKSALLVHIGLPYAILIVVSILIYVRM
jgi:positive regulator of sigma E activity